MMTQFHMLFVADQYPIDEKKVTLLILETFPDHTTILDDGRRY